MDISSSSVQHIKQQSHLLLIDDNPDQLRLLIEILRSKSYRISVAFDGFQGYDRALALAPDLIILDVLMPRMDGFALCRRLKANAATAHIPILFLSSASAIGERLTGLNGGAVDYILKPYEPEEVIARVQIHLALADKTSETGDYHRGIKSESPMDGDNVLVIAAQRELKSHLSITPKMSDIAAKLSINEKRLSRAFRKCLDMTPFEYLRQERMKEAKRLLTTTTLNIVAISQEVGFSSAANFSTAFREYTGMAPSCYRNENNTTNRDHSNDDPLDYS